MQQLALALDSNDFHIRRSLRAKRLRISVTPVGKIEVVIPTRVSYKEAHQFIQAQSAWISQRVRQIAAIRSDELDSLQPAEIKLPATQEYWKVVYSTGAPQLSIEQNPVTNVGVMHLMIEHEKNTADLLKTWLTDKAKATLLPWLRQVSQETGLNYNTANIRSQKTRWASCSSRKNISLNRCMLFLEPKEVQYLLIHELCHTREMNHSRRFWNLVSQFVPDYPEKERLINECCYKLPRWVY